MSSQNSKLIVEHPKIHLQKNEQVKVVKIYAENYKPFSMIGVMNTMDSKTFDTPDIFDRLPELSKGAIKLFTVLKRKLDPKTNIVYLPSKQMDRSKQVMFSRHISELKKVGLIKKAKTVDQTEPIRKGSYMFNPSLIKPWNLSKALKVWELL